MRKMLVGAAAALALMGGSMAHAQSSDAGRNSINTKEWIAVVLGGGLLIYALVEINKKNSPELPVSR